MILLCREVQRILMELLNQMDGFDQNTNVKVIMATNRADTLDPALLRPGRLDRKIEFPLPDRRQKRLVFQVSMPFRPPPHTHFLPTGPDGQHMCCLNSWILRIGEYKEELVYVLPFRFEGSITVQFVVGSELAVPAQHVQQASTISTYSSLAVCQGECFAER